ncbi:MAG: hypothetical protein WC512_05810 [Candidatus Omnitrophota bacterium]
MEKTSNISKKRIRLVALLFIGVCIFYVLFCQAVNKFLIPRVVIPKVREYLESGLTAPFRVSVGDISFEPVSGFLLKDVRLYTSQGSPLNYVAASEKVDVDLEWYKLLFGRIEIKRFDMMGADFVVSRDSSGAWDFAPLFAVDFGSDKKFRKFNVCVKEFRMLDGTLRYSDRLMPGNTIDRTFGITRASFTGDRNGHYNLVLLCTSLDDRQDSVSFLMDYIPRDRSGKGSIGIRTSSINDYWDYYLDDIFKPWSMRAGIADLKADFSFDVSGVSLKGSYAIKDGELRYGDFLAKCEVSVRHELDCPPKGKPLSCAQAVLTGIEMSAGKNTFFTGGRCIASVSGGQIEVASFTGSLFGKPVSYKGKVSGEEPISVDMEGDICGLRNAIDMQFPGPGKAKAQLRVLTSGSALIVDADTGSLDNLEFRFKVSGGAEISEIGPVFGISKDDMSGKITASGELTGELDRAETFNGSLGLELNDFSVLGIKPKDCSFSSKIENGLFDGSIPQFDLYGGTAEAQVRLDPGKWGFELDLDKCDLEEASHDSPHLAGIKGVVSANLACIGRWDRSEPASGGGYLNVSNCSFKSAPIFKAAEQGIGSVVGGFSMPDFKQIKTVLKIANRKVSIQGDCSAPLMRLEISGTYDINGSVEMTAGANVSQMNPIRTARQIILPVTISLDMVRDGIVVQITGKWPDLKQQTVIKPLRGFGELFGFMNSLSLKRYKLDELWAQETAPSK